MKIDSIKIIIATAIVMAASNFLVGCSPKQDVSEIGVERIAEAQEMKKTVTLSLLQIDDGKDLVLRLVLKNPEKSPITSTQAWLAYNPDLLKGLSIDTKTSAFEMTAPYDNDFDEVAGLVMLGRSTAKAVNDETITVAEIHFSKITDGVAMIEAYDHRQDLTGHTSANMMVDGTPVNILLKPQSPLLIIN